jgi:hypothetical protein
LEERFRFGLDSSALLKKENPQQKLATLKQRGAVRLKLPEKMDPSCLLCGKANTEALNEEK